MLVTVLMSVYNEPKEWIIECIESIVNQTYKKLEIIIIVDNPNNIEAINTIKQYTFIDKRIIMIINNKNLGLVKSLNKGIDISSGKYIARIDADDICYLDRIENQLKYILDTNLDILGGGRDIISESGDVIKKFKKEKNGIEYIKNLLEIKDIIYHPTWFIRKDVFIELNKYREIHAAEDYDFLIRALLKGFKIDRINTSVIKYRDRENSISNKNGLKQTLTSIYIRKAYRKGNELDLEVLDRNLKKIINSKSIKKYQSGMYYLNCAIKNKNNKINLCINLVKSITKSKYVNAYIINRLIYEIKCKKIG